MPRPRKSGGQAKELTSTEIVRVAQEIVRSPNGTRNLAIFELGLGAGMRIGEMCSLNLSDIFDGRGILDEIRLGYERCRSGIRVCRQPSTAYDQAGNAGSQGSIRQCLGVTRKLT